MKKILKSRIFLILVTAIIVGSFGVYAGSQILASDISYRDGTVESALNDLYTKAGSSRTATQVATLTTRGATYTMQNDGYIIGTAAHGGDGTMARIFLDEKTLALSNWELDDSIIYSVSVYATKGTVVTTRTDGGSYNLTVYEWK